MAMRMEFRQTVLCPNCMAGYVRNGVCTRCGREPYDRDRPEDALPLNYRLGVYILGKVLGHGGFGITYLAWDTRRNERVAVKELFPCGAVLRDSSTGFVRARSEIQNAENYFRHVRQRFRGEAQTVEGLRMHPEIIRIYDLFDALGTTYYVMEYLDGENLATMCARQGRMSWQQLEGPVLDTLQALKILHQYGMVHRDISPDNILVQQSGRTKLIDFGSVRSERADHFTTILKQEFAPWEQFLRNGNQGPWTDTYSFSASLYFLLSGGTAPKRSTERKISTVTGEKDPLIPLRSYTPDAPEYVINAITKGMSVAIENRYQTAEAMQNALFPVPRTTGLVEGLKLQCIRGQFAGMEFTLPIGQIVSLGREEGNDIAYPSGTRGISRKQCSFYVDENRGCYVQDQQSRYGTFLDGMGLRPVTWYRLNPGQTVTVGADSFRLGADGRR